ncbi:MAG: GreA/GreB family elongation factor [Desulfamplus sp.]|nr:GreA/GreB family elongation factor [Desulfamplus sp.]
MNLQKVKNYHPMALKINSITVHSKICIEDLDTGEEFSFILVPPECLDSKNGKISISTPIGQALLGQNNGNVIRWQAPTRLRKFRVKSVYGQI